MKIKFVSFTDYISEIEVYDLNKIDLFAYLLLKVIGSDVNKSIYEILLDLDITDDLMYLFENNLYYLIDNGLIKVDVSSEDIKLIKPKNVKLSEFGEYCLSVNTIPTLKEVRNKRIIYNPLKEEIVSDNKIIVDSNVVVYTDEINYLDLINKYKKEIMAIYNDSFVLNYGKVEKDPFYYEVEVDSKNIGDKYKKYLLENKVYKEENKELDENKKEFLSSNFKVDIYYGREDNVINSNYCLIVDEDKKFTISGNKVYVSNIIDEFNKYSFVGIDNELMGYNLGNIDIDGIKCSCIERKKINNYKSDIKKYLLKNRDKYENQKIVNEIIDLL